MRKKKFQLQTHLDRAQKNVYKKSIDESYEFLFNMCNHYKKLTSIDGKVVKFNKIVNNDLNKLFFEYLDWETLEERIEASKGNIYSNIYASIVESLRETWSSQQDKLKWEKIFGKSFRYTDNRNIKSWLLDLIFSNIIISPTWTTIIIDYEWVFDFPIPKKYVVWRALYYYIVNNRKQKEFKIWIYFSLKKIFKINLLDELNFFVWENNFQNYVNIQKHRYFYLKIAWFYCVILLSIMRSCFELQ